MSTKIQYPKNIEIPLLCHNSTIYVKYLKLLNKSFNTDCENLLMKFRDLQDLSFSSFTKAWKLMSFDSIFRKEDYKCDYSLFGENCFYIIKRLIVFCKSVTFKIGALYLMYVVYRTQYFGDAVKIRITDTEFNALLNLETSPVCGIRYITEYLKMAGAFHISIQSHSWGLEPKFCVQNSDLTNYIYKSEDASTINEKVCVLEDLKDVTNKYESLIEDFKMSEQYAEVLKTFERSTITNDIEDAFTKIDIIINNSLL